MNKAVGEGSCSDARSPFLLWGGLIHSGLAVQWLGLVYRCLLIGGSLIYHSTREMGSRLTLLNCTGQLSFFCQTSQDVLYASDRNVFLSEHIVAEGHPPRWLHLIKEKHISGWLGCLYSDGIWQRLDKTWLFSTEWIMEETKSFIPDYANCFCQCLVYWSKGIPWHIEFEHVVTFHQALVTLWG